MTDMLSHFLFQLGVVFKAQVHNQATDSGGGSLSVTWGGAPRGGANRPSRDMAHAASPLAADLSLEKYRAEGSGREATRRGAA